MTHFHNGCVSDVGNGNKGGSGEKRRKRKKKEDMREERGGGGEREGSEALPGLRYFIHIIAVSLTTSVRGRLYNYMHLEKKTTRLSDSAHGVKVGKN